MNGNARVRVHVVGVVVVVSFLALLARLWFLQTGSTTAQAITESQTTRTVRTATPRGLVYDRSGTVLVGNRVSWAITADAYLRNAAKDSKVRGAVVPRLAELLGTDVSVIERRLDDKRLGPLESVVVAADVSATARTRVAEHPEDFEHLAVVPLAVRWYPTPGLAAQMLGYLGRVNSDDLRRHPDYDPNDSIGRTGVEALYEASLRGVPAVSQVEVNAAGNIVGDPLHTDPGRNGHDVRLTLDAKVQAAAQAALDEGIAIARTEVNEDLTNYGLHTYRAPAGAVVVLDTTNGDVVAMASNPTFDNSRPVGEQFDELSKPENHTPLLNRTTSGLYAPGSTFKLVSGLATVTSGTRGIFEPFEDTGCYKRGASFTVCSPGRVPLGVVDLRIALLRSSDVYFYSVGDELWNRWKGGDTAGGDAIQHTAREFGFGAETGVGLDEASGVVPDAAYKRRLAERLYPKGSQELDANNDWNPGDNISLAVGQGDLLVTPLQLADAYAALANGGTVWQPRIVDSITQGRATVRTIAPKQHGHVDIPPDVRQALLDGFGGAVTDTKGTAYGAFIGFPFDRVGVTGKTGTAQVGRKKILASEGGCVKPTDTGFDVEQCFGDTSWFAGTVAPEGTDRDNPRYVVVAMVEQGGRGGRIAAPIARQVIEALTGLPRTPIPTLTATAGARG